MLTALLICAVAALGASFGTIQHAARCSATSPIHFTYRPIPFTLDNDESPRKYVAEIMAGGVAGFDYDNDGDLDIYFTNGAETRNLKKTSPKF